MSAALGNYVSENPSDLGNFMSADNQAVRWVVEQTLALLHQFRRLATRWERRTDIHHGLLTLATSIICWRRLPNRIR